MSGDNKYVVSASDDKTLKVWSLDTGDIQKLNYSIPASNTIIRFFLPLLPLLTKVIDYFFNWKSPGEEIHSLEGHSDRVNAVAISGDNKYVVSASEDYTLKVWSLDTGEEFHSFESYSHRVNAVAISGDIKYVVSASYDETLEVWSLDTGEEIHSFEGHSHWVNAVAISGDSKYVVSASRDKTLKVWSLDTGEEITCPCEYEMNCCEISSDGKTIIAGDSGGYVHFLRWEN
ncbi:WD repeat-containing protein [Calothrix parasitica NIES-267]|uniref:WD repeat-containing protein n=1 Tax=Calothrix parasitica NIES-267 TaxID=1973488 RepID=A0A1Z4LUE9_9CYAN|nr:WD repeat-containing protein [Calothrix parasitica NIES-267]